VLRSNFAMLHSLSLVTLWLPRVGAQTTLSDIALTPCCIVADGHGGNFVVSGGPTQASAPPSTISVAKMDSGGNVVSQFAFHPGPDTTPASAAVDPQGNLWIVGRTLSASAVPNPTVVGLIAELDSTGTHVLYSGLFGGNNADGYTSINAITFDSSGNWYLGGYTSQSDFPLTASSFMSQFGTTPPAAGCTWSGRVPYGFVSKLALASQGALPYTLVYSTLLGGQQLPPGPCGFPPQSIVSALAVDANGVVTAGGVTETTDFPITPGAYQTQYEGATNDVNVFVTRLNAEGSALVWSTLLAAPLATGYDNMLVSGVALDTGGDVVLTGITNAPSVPVTAGALQSKFATLDTGEGYTNGFVAKVDSTGSRLLFSTYYGVANWFSAPRLDAQGNIWFTASVTDPSSVPLQPNSLILGGSLIAEIAPDGSIVMFSELLPNGELGQDLVLNPDGSLTAAGPPPSGEAIATNGFVVRLPRGTPSGVSVLGVADSAANVVTNTVAPGEFLSIYGTGLGPSTGAAAQAGSSGRLGTSIGATQVAMNGIPAPLLYAADGQINALVPYEIAGAQQVSLTITSSAGTSQTGPLQVVAVQPSIFAVLNPDGSVNSYANPAPPGALVTFLVSGAGGLAPALPDGTIAPSPAPAPVSPVSVNFTYDLPSITVPVIGRRSITPAYAAGVPGVVIDLLRVDSEVPDLGAGVYSIAFMFTATVQVGSAQSGVVPVFAIPGE
jgi:uncharacterized protein (TIGR03437 family)